MRVLRKPPETLSTGDFTPHRHHDSGFLGTLFPRGCLRAEGGGEGARPRGTSASRGGHRVRLQWSSDAKPRSAAPWEPRCASTSPAREGVRTRSPGGADKERPSPRGPESTAVISQGGRRVISLALNLLLNVGALAMLNSPWPR